MFTHEEFATEVTRQFGFLESDYGMRGEPLQRAEGRWWMTFANVDVKVIVECEENGYCSVSVQNLRHIKHDPLERSEFDLDEIVAAGGPRPPRRQELRSSRESVAKAAETLKTLARPVLAGDFDTLHTRQRKTVEMLRRHDLPPLPTEAGESK